jgi:uncharacterized RDD family membrane protein YckC
MQKGVSSVEQAVDLEREKKKNIRIAIGVAAFGIGTFMAVYVLMFALMFISPFTIFQLFPAFSWTENVIGVNNKLFILSKRVDFKGASRENPPAEITAIEMFDGKSLSGPVDIPSFASIAPAKDKLYFFSEGMYRAFDGEKWEEGKNPAIGSTPKGAVGEEGIWVLSTMKEKPVLALLTTHDVRSIPLPDGALTSLCSSQLVSAGKGLSLFWKKDKSLFWSVYDGKKWVRTASFEDIGQYRAIASNNGVELFQVREFGGRPSVIMRTYKDDAWSEQKTYELRGLSFHTIPMVFQNTPALYRQELFAQRYYLLDEERMKGPLLIRKQFLIFRNTVKMIALALVANALFFLAVFLISVVIGKFKLRTWRIDSREYEFASLFRRFLAKMIDSFIVLGPIVAAFYFLLTEDMFRTNPFKFMAFFIFGILSLVVGGFLYHSLLEGLRGKTLGKKICGIVVLKDDFTPCTLGRGFTRNIMRIVDTMFSSLVGVTAMAGTMKWQRLGDLVAETVVVKHRKKT